MGGIHRVRWRVIAGGFGILFVLLFLGSPLFGGEQRALIVLMTDFGEKDYYVGALKGVIHTLAPDARIEDLTHEVTPYDIREGAVTLRNAALLYPGGTIFCAVVDPGVGTERKAIAGRTPDGKYFVGPDNGLLSLAIAAHGGGEVREITNPEWFREGKPSTTFHGRDIFAPVAARLAAGWNFSEIGARRQNFIRLPYTPPALERGALVGEIERIDRYGNLVSNIPVTLLQALGLGVGDSIMVTIGTQHFTAPFVSTYGAVPSGTVLCLAESQGRIECAVNRGNLADRLRCSAGTPLRITAAREKQSPGEKEE
ncbi:MAG: hypothetical protein D6812_06440 [Deltaproteobacteria bacterium]|nr:MAG: hypothetical protein D6812_06440 [Deltaproteobacteria bacterium]